MFIELFLKNLRVIIDFLPKAIYNTYNMSTPCLNNTKKDHAAIGIIAGEILVN